MPSSQFFITSWHQTLVFAGGTVGLESWYDDAHFVSLFAELKSFIKVLAVNVVRLYEVGIEVTLGAMHVG